MDKSTERSTGVGDLPDTASDLIQVQSPTTQVAEGDCAETNDKPLTFFEVMGSTFAAALGVQSKENLARDFSRGKPLHFIMAGLIFAATFVVVVIAVVRTVLSQVT